MDLLTLSALELSAKIHAGETTVREALDAAYRAIELEEPRIHAFVSLCKEDAYAKAQAVQERLDAGEELSPLAGVPIAVKDNICTKGVRTTCGSRMLEGFVPTYNAHVVDLLESAGLVILGKTNMDEFAMGSTTETSALADTRNPVDPERVPGGSSGGSAAAVAAGEVRLALGSDTGGSIRQPSAFCGVTGLKPTYGSVSRYGLVAYASSLDQIGPIGKNAADCAALYAILRGKDQRDATSMPAYDAEQNAPYIAEHMNAVHCSKTPDEFVSAVKDYSLAGKKIGIPREFFGEGLQEDVAARVREAAAALESLGAQIEEFDLPVAKYAVPAYYIIACAEACSNLSRYDGIKYGYSSPDAEDLRSVYINSRSQGFGMEVKRRIMLGNFVLSSGYYDSYYKKALQVKRLVQDALTAAFERYDMVLGPVYPTTALRRGEGLSDPLKLYLGDIYTVMVNLAGLPALSLPCGADADGLPVGLQLIGKPFGEGELLGAGNKLQITINN
ncbi:MAG: aspartyl/glutamyl-tRNA amidotransferase subunit A [Oscillospiraceae bacterium]|jgi:aspartyl-tRNA(Asn)/glutamyl-tRNA(Gln) amidotransferase subunit A|nr:aspartyl/glutamyl-tRNA amidotransferase subunit A [Oscillospiraceae bacterium]